MLATRFYDLHINESQLEAQTQRERVALAVKLGYDGVALVHQAKETLSERDRCCIQPTQLAALVSASQGVGEALDRSRARHALHGNAYTFRQLTRLDFPANEVSTAQAVMSNTGITGTYDLLAVQPHSERAFALACTSLDVDIVSLDLSRRLPYRFKPTLVKAALGRGLHFEICFSPALREAGARRQLFANAQALCRETRGRNVIVASCARSAMELRAPHDVMNMATLFGLSQQQAQHAISQNVEAALQHAAARKAYRGVLTIQLVEDTCAAEADSNVQVQPTSMQIDAESEQSTGQLGSSQAAKQQQNQQQQARVQKQKFGQVPQLIGQKRR